MKHEIRINLLAFVLGSSVLFWVGIAVWLIFR